MTLAELYTNLNKICNTARGRFKQPPSLPYILYLDGDSESISADYANLGSKDNISIVLASEIIDSDTEAQIENVIIEHEYVKTRQFVESEKLWQTTYEIQIIKV